VGLSWVLGWCSFEDGRGDGLYVEVAIEEWKQTWCDGRTGEVKVEKYLEFEMR